MATRTDQQRRRAEPVAAPREQLAQVEALHRTLEARTGSARGRASRWELVGPNGETFALPEAVFRVLKRVVQVMARGDSIAVVAVAQQLSTQQAADVLNVSRQYLVRLLDEKRIPCTKTGSHRRIRLEDVLSFKEKRDRNRRAGMRELSRLSQEFGGHDVDVK